MLNYRRVYNSMKHQQTGRIDCFNLLVLCIKPSTTVFSRRTVSCFQRLWRHNKHGGLCSLRIWNSPGPNWLPNQGVPSCLADGWAPVTPFLMGFSWNFRKLRWGHHTHIYIYINIHYMTSIKLELTNQVAWLVLKTSALRIWIHTAFAIQLADLIDTCHVTTTLW